MNKKLEEVKVPNRLIIKKGGGHGWKDITVDEENVISWFNQYLK